MKVSPTILFWVGCAITILAAGLQLIIPDIRLVLFLLTIVGVALAAWQKYRGDHEQQAALQRVWNDTQSGREHAARSQLHKEMHMDSQEPHS